MRYQGRITKWNDDKGFGFVVRHGDETLVFVHIKAFARGAPRPQENDIITYEIGKDENGRNRAVRVAFPRRIDSVDTTQSELGWVAICFTMIFLSLLIYAVSSGRISLYILFMYTAASLLAFIVYAWDKSSARNNDWRTSESTLLFFGLICGWPGAFMAQRLLHHKNKKKTFQNAFWITVVFNIFGLVLLTSDAGLTALRNLFGVW
ncbi:DUF1294 domain-containing protein [Stenotrophobium rhamnosiphilum]|uniref:DUF1294 domain-containing protein n=1 Tax=Stenotrophobium rhamnosiphilum TaxID=2029166 RepID=UPI001374F5DE|nr:cold shock and DUF1294 domain-containing protein [Stenotrophobium rhamnosiphilum]